MGKIAPLKGASLSAGQTLTIQPVNPQDQIVVTNMNMSGTTSVTVNISNGTDTFVLGSLPVTGTLDGILPQTLSQNRKMVIVNGGGAAKLDIGGYYEFGDTLQPPEGYQTITS